MIRRLSRLMLAASVVGSAGCATLIDSAADAAARRTGQSIGEAAGARIGAAAVGTMPGTFSPEMTTQYVGHLFHLGFQSGTYTYEERAYEPGEWTRWIIDGDSDLQMERAFLGRTPDSEEWWRVKYTDRSGDGGEIILEGLFSAGRDELIRLRALMPDDEEPQELPVQEGTHYDAPRRLTAASVEGATVGVESIRVPAGTFNARHVRYGAGAGTQEWWFTDQVPGGMIRYTIREPDGDEGAIVELSDHGGGATSELGVI